MSEDLNKSPVPVRLAYRYPNGSMVSYSARAIARKGDAVTVVVNEFFDDGITLAVHAPFLEGLTNFRVVSVSRSIRRPGYFETQLRPAEAVPVGEGNGLPYEGGTKAGPASAASPETRQPGPLPEAIAAAAGVLGTRLSLEPPMRFSEALRGLPTEGRATGLLVGIAGVLHCLNAAKGIEARALVKIAGRSPKLPPATQHANAAVADIAG